MHAASEPIAALTSAAVATRRTFLCSAGVPTMVHLDKWRVMRTLEGATSL
jgi:hypothetical protein